MYVRDFEGNEYPVQATSTLDAELNGNVTLSFTILPTKTNSLFIDKITEMWTVVDHDGVEYKIIYCKKQGVGNRLRVNVKAIPLFFDKFDSDRIYEEYNEHMTAHRCFSIIFAGTGFNFVLIDPFPAIQWEGFGGGETRLKCFKDALNRYGAEFRFVGNTVYLEKQIGRDTNFMYRHKLNASNIVKEIDASAFYTYAKGYGDYEDGEESEGGGWQNAKLIREYTSPLALILGVRHAPPIKDGRIKDPETMDKKLKELVDNSLKISVSADIHDLRKQGYPLAQPELGDRVFLIDERIGLNTEVRVVEMSVTKNWKGEIIDLKLTFGSPGLLRRYQSNLRTATSQINDLIEGRSKLPFSVLDEAVQIATRALQRAQTELIFENGIIARDKNDPNRLVLFNSQGVGISDDGGATFREAITADGFVLTAGAVGRLAANHIQIGPETEFAENYDPSKKETPEGAQEKVDRLRDEVDKDLSDIRKGLGELDEYIDTAFKDGLIEEAEAIAIEKYINSLTVEKEDIDTKYQSVYTSDYLDSIKKRELLNAKINFNGAHDTLITTIQDAIADGRVTDIEKEAVDRAFDDYRVKLSNLTTILEEAIDLITRAMAKEAEENAKKHADNKDEQLREDLNLAAPLPTSIRLDNNGITAYTSIAGRYARLDYRGLYIAGGAIQIDGGLPDSQIRSADRWNRQGTYIDENGIYTGAISANQVRVGFNQISNYVRIVSSGLETYQGSERTSLLDHRGHRFYRDGNYIGSIGTSHWVNRTNYRGITFQLTSNASYMAWSHDDDGDGVFTVKLAWHKDNTVQNKGFGFWDNAVFYHGIQVYNRIRIGSDNIAIIPYNNAVRWAYNDNNYIRQWYDGQVEIISGGRVIHAFFPSGTKSGGTIEIENKRYGMSPIDSPQVLIEYIEFDVELSEHGTKIYLDETFIKAVSDFSAFTNNGEIVEKGKDYIVIKGEKKADIRFVGKRINYDDAFWVDIQTIEMTGKEEAMNADKRPPVLDA